ncbi:MULTISPECIES: caspase family protein [unclassified Bradyrhizobium]|uniref:caspase family protein n=1 Tax=unclassified Bradyrhizobium TaxID=2631580 RepID=UPI0020B2D133|nr:MULTISPECIES: caspase family protein [unclassified Bradyrhizobium]MCP3400019.1 caspase family protein [Bradyrhizobium sp. CCGB20]MCP3408642.1 caspase family protein [Bradyrhizobium sp. CCGB01]
MRTLTLLASLMCMALSVSAANADRRVAFVVGNGSYKNVAQLPNPPIDAKAMAATLRNVGFEVIEGSNLSRDQMTEKLLDFGRKAQGSDVAVFYYAGHGIAVGGSNYLLPVDADIKSEMDVKLGAAINIDLTLEQTMGDAKVKLVFLDACRDNPFAAKIKSNSATRSVNVQSGLAEMKSGEGTLIAFATGPGQTALDGQEGNNSPFTRALIDNITKPGVEIQQAMTSVRAQVNEETRKGQLPWGHTNLIGAVYLNPSQQTQVANAAPTAAGSIPAAAATNGSDGVELEYWRSVKESNKPEELNAYLAAYPNGQFKALALARLAAIKSGPSTATRTLNAGVDPAAFTDEASQLTEDQIGLDKNQRRDVQRRLTGLGFDTKQTGAFSDDTRSVIKRWQAARGYPSSGYLNKPQHKALLSEVVAAPATASDSSQKAARRAASAPAGSAPAPAPAPRSNPGDAAGAAFVGGVVGGMMGGMFRR